MSTGDAAHASPASGANGEPSAHNGQTRKTDSGIDDFGLPTRPSSQPISRVSHDSDDDSEAFHDAQDIGDGAVQSDRDAVENTSGEPSAENQATPLPQQLKERHPSDEHEEEDNVGTVQNGDESAGPDNSAAEVERPSAHDTAASTTKPVEIPNPGAKNGHTTPPTTSARNTHDFSTSPILKKDKRTSKPTVSEWSHQQLAPKHTDSDDEEEEEVAWQAMPALGEFDVYDDDGRIVAKALKDGAFDEKGGMSYGAAGKGYTRVQLDEDAQSATSMDDDTNYLFKQPNRQANIDYDEFEDDDDKQRDAASQLENTKDLLTEGQRIAYVGLVRLTVFKMLTALENVESTKATKKELTKSLESMELWGQKTMVWLYRHMEIESAEQLMIEQLAEHGVQPADLVPALMQNARVKNPMADDRDEKIKKPSVSEKRISTTSQKSVDGDSASQKEAAEGDVPELQNELPHTANLDLDIRWTVLCDLFLLLISESKYDSRSRRLLERVASSMQITWLQICRFEKRVIDALEMQEQQEREDLDEADNMEDRRKKALKRKYMYMGLATVGGGLVIGLSAGLLAPVIGAGLAAGFTTIGIGGTGAFLGGVGGAALITSIGVTTGGTIAVRASSRRTGHVKTFEYRPLHNNKRLNLILTVSGWMNGKVDDVRLPYSTVDPIMGDIYSLLWEPEMLQSMGDTINILATEALTQTVQQVLGSTILVALMASIQLPIVLTKLSYLIDNPWSVSLDRANAAGLILADSLMQNHLGKRPITVVGFSLGARVIFSCLKELSARGAYGIIQNVYLFGSPVVARKEEYVRARSVISGRFVNGYASNDWILGYLFRATAGGIMRVSGLAPVEDVPGLENIDVSQLVNGHMAYRAAMPRLLREVGWEVESDEFTEIEDPDPENHEKRQRELIREIDDARKKAEEKPGKTRFGFFKRGMLAEKREWEKYDAKAGHTGQKGGGDVPGGDSSELNVLFDIDAIRKELESEMIEVRELDSTLPPMQITSKKDGEKHVEYLRLPPEVDLSKDEIGRMKLPPRPDEVDVNITGPRPTILPRKSSLRPSPKQSPKSSPQPSPRRVPSPVNEEDFMPRELVSTLPPLNLTPSMSQEAFDPPSTSRPPLRTNVTEPPPSALDRGPVSPLSELGSPIDKLNLEHNAWAHDGDFAQDKEVRMTFE